jgi:AsmA protein
MKLLLKLALGLLGLAVAVLVALAIAVAVLFDPAQYKPLLAESVSEATGRKFTLDGELGLDYFPCCSVTLGRAALGNPQGFPDGEFASVEGAALSLEIWPLVTRGAVEIGVVRLQGLNANLLARKDGVANWELTGEPPGGKAGGAAADAAVPGRLAIEGIEIRGGRIAYRDEGSGADYLAEELELDTGDLTPGERFDLTLSAKLTDRADGTSGKLTLATAATLAPDLSRVEFAKPTLDVTASGKAIPATSLTAKLGAAALAVEFRQDTHLTFTDLQCDFALAGFEAAADDVGGSFSAGDTSLALGASSELIVPQLQADVIVSGKDIPGGVITTKLATGKISADVDKLWASVESLSAEVNGLGARLALTGKGRIGERGAKLDGTLLLDPLSPRSVLAVLKEPEPETADPQALTRLAGRANWALGKDSLALSGLDFQLDQTRLTGSVGLEGFDKPVTRFDLDLDALDLDRYLAPDPKPNTGTSESGAAGEAEEIPVETIRDLRLDGRLRIAQLTLAKAKLSTVNVNLRAADGRLRLEPLAARLYGGEYRGAVSIDATGPVAKLSMEQKLDGVQVAGVLQDLYQNDKLTGALGGSISATATGNGNAALLRTLDGAVAVSIADGAYLGTDLWHEIRSARALIRGEAAPAAPANPQTKFNALELAGRIDDGVLGTDRLLAEIPFARLTGAGTLNLVTRTLDCRLQGQVFENPAFEDGSSIKDLKGLTIPITLAGAMDEPKVGVDLKGLALGAATQKLKDRLLKKLGGDEQAPAEQGDATGQAAPADPSAPSEQPPKEEKPRDVLKRSLRDLLKQQ